MNSIVLEKRERLNEDILNEIESKLYELDCDFKENKKIFFEKYKSETDKVLNLIISMQETKNLDLINVISFVLSRTNIHNDILSYKIKLYGEKMYVDSLEFSYSLDVSDIYKYFISAKDFLYNDVKKYVGVMTSCDVETIIYQYLKYFNMYVVDILREVFSDKEVLQTVAKINKSEPFYVLQNEIYETPYLIFKHEKG